MSGNTSSLWTLKYRPQTFQDVAGQNTTTLILKQMVETSSVPSGLIFAGVRGAGKTSSARILGMAMNCEKAPYGPCQECVHCKSVQDGSSLDVIEIDGASNGSVAAIQDLRQQLLYTTTGEWRIVLLDEVHSLSNAAFNALLKTLEEPPDRTIFVLLTTEPGKILSTVTSRCMTFEFRKISHEAILTRLRFICKEEGFPAEEPMLDFIAERSGGGLRDAIMSLDQAHRVGITMLADFMALVGAYDFAPSLVQAMVAGDLREVARQTEVQLSRIGDSGEITSDLTRTIRDVLVIKAGGTTTASGDGLAIRKELAARVEHKQLIGACTLLWDLKTKVRPGEDPRAILDLAVVLLTEVLSSGVRKTALASVPKTEQRLTLDELKAMVPQ